MKKTIHLTLAVAFLVLTPAVFADVLLVPAPGRVEQYAKGLSVSRTLSNGHHLCDLY
jgi:hypothetical protein